MCVLIFPVIYLGLQDDDRPVIGISLYDMKFDFFKEMEKGARTHLEEMSYRSVVEDQRSDTNKQIESCLELIGAGIKALIVSPINSTAMSRIIKEAHGKNIYVIVIDIGCNDPNYDAYVVSDGIEGGRMAGEFLKDVLERENKTTARVAVFRNNPEVAVAHSRGDGFLEIASEYGWYKEADIVAEGETEPAYRKMSEMLRGGSKVDVVFCTNDPMALGVSRACIDNERKDVRIIGFNGDVEALSAIREGKMLATIQMYPYAMGEIAADLADMLIRDVPIDFDLPDSKTVLIPVALIHEGNVDNAYKSLH
jgi:ribose transport system substrate-binding protein